MFDKRLAQRCVFILFLVLGFVNTVCAQNMDFIRDAAHSQSGKTGVYVLEKGEDALLARAWLADHAKESINVQYFIWSSDNIGILATEALLRAADRGVTVRVIVDDLLVDAPDKTLLALAKHPKIEIKIYNPKHKVGTPLHKRVLNMLSDFRGFNQRMHDKTFMVDGLVGITGGRNMADEYFDYDHKFNFRDRDVLLVGQTVKAMEESFERFWSHKLSVPVEALYDGFGIMQKNVSVKNREIASIYKELHDYANNPENFESETRQAITAISDGFPALAKEIRWTDVEFISDIPGKNDSWISLHGGGRSTLALAKLIASAKKDVVIQSPYLILTDETKALFKELIDRGVRIRISTNSLASTDNLQAFSGYTNQRWELLEMGLEIFEYKPNPAVHKEIMQRYEELKKKFPIFSLHAKSLVVDSEISYVGTFNLDPRSINLNTEVGAIIKDRRIAKQVEGAIVRDMKKENSWQAGVDNPDRNNSLWKRSKVLFWQFMPIEPLL